MDGGEHSLTKTKTKHALRTFPLLHFSVFGFFFLSLLLFPTPKGDAIIRPVSTCIQGSFFFFFF